MTERKRCIIVFSFSSSVRLLAESPRIGAELGRRGINYSFGASDYWLWNVVGSLIVVGPFIFFNKLFTAMNMLSENYNVNG